MVPFRASLLRRMKLRLLVGWAVSIVTAFHLDTVVMIGTDAAFSATWPLQKVCVSSHRRKTIRTTMDKPHTRFGVTLLQSTNDVDDVDDRIPAVATRSNESPKLLDLSSPSLTSSSTTSALITKSIKENTISKQKKNANGVYIRPSAAIERGSGFFVPGLEGYKVRLLVGVVVVLLTVLLHYYHTSISINTNELSNRDGAGNNLAESLAIFYGLLVLLQGCIEARKDFFTISRNSNEQTLIPASNGKRVQVYQQQWSIEVSDTEWRNKVEWVASTYLSLTSATDMILVGPGKIIFSLGLIARPSKSNRDDVDDNELRGCNGALATLAQSKSGRLSLPMNHITVQTLLFPRSIIPNDRVGQESVNSVPRSVIIQRINDQLCWMMVSDQLLASFSTSDLQWLGQLAQYIDSE